MNRGISLQLSPHLDVSFKVGGRMGHWMSLGVVDTIAREISRGVRRWGGIQCAFPLVDDGILLCEPGAKVSLFVGVKLVLGHLVPPSGPLWHGELSQLGCDPVESEHCDVGRDGSPEDDGACQSPGVIEKALVELDKLALEAACVPGLAGTPLALLRLFWLRGIAALDCTLELELGLALFSRE